MIWNYAPLSVFNILKKQHTFREERRKESMEEDRGSTATMTSVTEDLSLDDTDTSTHNDIDTSSQITSSDALEAEGHTVMNTPLPSRGAVKDQLVVASEVSMDVEGGNEVEEEMITSTDDENHVYHGRQGKDGTQLNSSHRQPWGSGVQMPEAMKMPRAMKMPDVMTNHEARVMPGDMNMPDAMTMPDGMTIPNVMTMEGEWYRHECFRHYWQHYHYVSMWCRKHMETYKAVVDQYNRTMTAAPQQTAAARHTGQQDDHVFKKPVSKKTLRNRRARRRRKAFLKRQKMEQRMGIRSKQSDESCSSLSSVSQSSRQPAEEEGATGKTTTTKSSVDKVTHAHEEFADDLLDFFAHSHRHKQERDALKESQVDGKEKKHVNIEDQDGKKVRTEEAPVERPGFKRTSEMQQLYGKGAPMIHGMETALQMTFDRNADVLQPRMWPNMPLRVIFSPQ